MDDERRKATVQLAFGRMIGRQTVDYLPARLPPAESERSDRSAGIKGIGLASATGQLQRRVRGR